MDDQLDRSSIEEMVKLIEPNWRVEHVEAATSGTDAVYFLTADNGSERIEAVLKICTAVPPEDFRPEPVLCRVLRRRTSIPIPKIYGMVETHSEYPAPFYLMERCEGTLAEELERTDKLTTAVATAAGRHAGEYHRIAEFQRFGFLRLDTDLDQNSPTVTLDGRGLAVSDRHPDDDYEIDTSLWRQYGTEMWRTHLESLYRYYIADLDGRFTDLQEPIESFVEDRLHTVHGSFDARLSHIDYQYTNVLVDPDTCETTAVLDWGHATAVDPYYDLVVTEHHLCKRAPLYSPDRNRVREALEAGYEETNSIERDEGFERRRELYLLVPHLQALFWFSTWFEDAPETKRADMEAQYRSFVMQLLTENGYCV